MATAINSIAPALCIQPNVTKLRVFFFFFFSCTDSESALPCSGRSLCFDAAQLLLLAFLARGLYCLPSVSGSLLLTFEIIKRKGFRRVVGQLRLFNDLFHPALMERKNYFSFFLALAPSTQGRGVIGNTATHGHTHTEKERTTANWHRYHASTRCVPSPPECVADDADHPFEHARQWPCVLLKLGGCEGERERARGRERGEGTAYEAANELRGGWTLRHLLSRTVFFSLLRRPFIRCPAPPQPPALFSPLSSLSLFFSSLQRAPFFAIFFYFLQIPIIIII